MKLTVSSTAMMKPLLQTENHPPRKSPPSRVAGLLDVTEAQLNQNRSQRKLVQYVRPDKDHAQPQTVKWQNLVQLDHIKKTSCVAVFGFVFDGVTTWYQVWNRTTDSSCWLQHRDDMTYESFAILVMDALVTLLPNWDGTLHQSPDSRTGAYNAAPPLSETIDAGLIHNVLISDASTGASGRLWFLVTINSSQKQCDSETTYMATRSGWISPVI